MNASGRGPRLGGKDDFYETPAWCVYRLLEAWTPTQGNLVGLPVVEPAFGSGAILWAVEQWYSRHRFVCSPNWTGYEIRKDRNDLHWMGLALESSIHFETDFLAIQAGDASVSAVITNPPYSLAEDFLRRSRTLYPNADIAFLLRMAFLASEARLSIWATIGHPDIYVLPNRPSFANEGKTDSADYAWFVWPTEVRSAGALRVLASTPLRERGRR